VLPKPTEHNGIDPFNAWVELLRDRVKHARRRYKEKALVSAALAAEWWRLPPGADPVAWLAFRQTLQLETEALRRYMQALSMYRKLVIDGIPPPEQEHDSW
jgi:hypothetical protein